MFEAIILVIIPAILVNVLHMFIVKKDVFSFLTIPINTRLFGTNKTWRGFAFSIVFTSFFCAIATSLSKLNATDGALLGAIMGFTYMLFELPNSMFKRLNGIASGETPTKRKLLYNLLDKTDSAFGVSLMYTLLSDLSLIKGVLLFFISSGLHISISYLLVKIKMKKSF